MRLLLSILLSSLAGLAQPRPAPLEPPAANLPAQSIGPNDLLSILVYDAPELSRTVRVSSEGRIKLPMLPAGLEVSGKLPVEVETLIAYALVKAEILVSPVVTVTVAEYHSRPINVSGAVKNPLTFQAVGPTRLLDALGKAGGLSESAASAIYVTPPGESAPRRIPIKELLSGSKPELNIALSGGEEISVPAAGRV